jgi:hypothetical protein
MTDEPDDLKSLVDFLKSEGVASDFKAREHIAAQYDIVPYTGSAAQNAHLLAVLKAVTAADVPEAHRPDFHEAVRVTSAWRLWERFKLAFGLP